MLAHLARGLSGGLTASALLLGTATVALQTPAPTPQLRQVSDTTQATVGTQFIQNPGFNSGTTGWTAAGRFAVSKVGLNGSLGAQLTSDQLQMVTLTATPRPVTSTAAGSVYRAGAWVRTSRVGQRGALVVREWLNGRVAAEHRLPFTLDNQDWRSVSVQVPVQAPGSSLAVQVQAAGQRVNDRFAVDNVTLRLVSAGTTTTTTTTA